MRYTEDPLFWRAGAIATTLFMSVVLAALTIDTLRQITPGGARVPSYDVINSSISYEYSPDRGEYVPAIGGEELLFGHRYTAGEAARLIAKGKLVIQSRACIDCHTFFGNGAYYAPDLTRAWLDPVWARYAGPKRADRMAKFLMDPFRLGARPMPNLNVQRDEAEAAVAYLKWMSAVDTNGFPDRFGAPGVQ
ncbi:MAG TPA: c-type cytochrome [Candidatus Binataceae bacterium]|nr:c-type cytochrome [Candidatus Binataceae bacterium]